MVHAQVLEAYLHFALVYTADHTFPVILMKYLTNEDGKPTALFKLATGTKTFSIIFTCVVFPCVVQKVTAHVDGKALNMCHQAQKGFHGIFVGIPQHQQEYHLYVPISGK